ncbi:hypothetical protein MAR_000901, partial [Mya arenaria]
MSSSQSYIVNTRPRNIGKQECQISNKVSHATDVDATMDNSEASGMSEEFETPLPFQTENDFTDVLLLVEDRQLYTNRSLLAFASPAISLPDKSYQAVSDMLSFLHPGVEFSLSRDNVFPLLALAEEYQVHVLKTACEDFLLQVIKDQQVPVPGFLVRCLVTAETCAMTGLQDTCISVFADPDVPLKVDLVHEVKESEEVTLATKAVIFERRLERMDEERREVEAWRAGINSVKRRLREIVYPHDDHCRCRVEVKLRHPLPRSCPYCTRTWCSDNISTDAYRNTHQFYCNHK